MVKNNRQFAHLTKIKDIENFYKIMTGEKKILTKKDKLEWEANYFAMCLLLPRQLFMNLVEFLGGIEFVKNNYDAKCCLSRIFFVEYRLVEIRINELLERINLEKEDNYKLEKKNYFRNNLK